MVSDDLNVAGRGSGLHEKERNSGGNDSQESSAKILENQHSRGLMETSKLEKDDSYFGPWILAKKTF